MSESEWNDWTAGNDGFLRQFALTLVAGVIAILFVALCCTYSRGAEADPMPVKPADPMPVKMPKPVPPMVTGPALLPTAPVPYSLTAPSSGGCANGSCAAPSRATPTRAGFFRRR